MHRIVIVLLTLLTTMSLTAQTPQFVAKASSSVVVGVPFYLQYELNVKGSNIRPPALDGFQQKAGPTLSSSSNYTYVNGKASSTKLFTYTYVLVAEKEGTYNIAPASIEVKGKKIYSNSLTIRVLKGGDASGGTSSEAGVNERDIFLRSMVNKTSPYQNEALVYTIKLYTTLQVSRITDADYPDFNGFLASDIGKDQTITEQVETYKGRTYRTYTIHQKLLYPQRSGEFNIAPAVVSLNIRQRVQRRSYSPFDDFFNGGYQDVGKQLKSNGVKVKVRKLPGVKPTGFKGLVGKYSLQSSITNVKVKENDPVTIKLVLSGEGNLKMLPTPEPNFPEDFEKYDPKVKNNLKTTLGGVNGTRTFEYLVIPRFAGKFIIPAIKIPYFDIQSGNYKTLSSKEFVIEVEKGEGETQSTVVSNFTSKEDVKFLGKDIRYIKTNKNKLKPKGQFLFGSGLFWLLLLLPLFIYIVILIIYRKQAKMNANAALVKNKKANKVAKKRMKRAREFMKKEEKEGFYDEVLRAMWGYLSDKLNIPPSELNKDDIEGILKGKNVDEHLVTDLLELLHTCEFARYAPASVSGGMQEIYKNAVSIVSDMDNKIRK